MLYVACELKYEVTYSSQELEETKTELKGDTNMTPKGDFAAAL